MLDYFWLTLLFPLLGTLVNGLVGRRLRPGLISLIGCGTILLSFLMTLFSLLEVLRQGQEQAVRQQHLFTWIESGSFVSNFSLLIDPLSLLMMMVVTGVGFLIHVYSIGYMAGEPGYYRYFSYLNLFILMMSILVLADNYLLMFVGWEGVGLCSYLLIGYYFEKKSAGDAAKKAFIVNRIGDIGFILGIFLIFQTFGSIEYRRVFQQAAGSLEVGSVTLEVITLLLFIGAVGKSAQIPLYVWLPDAMEGPTPVSALIHAATMVTAGVYMIARSAAFYSRAPQTLMIVAVVGVATALMAALIALAQTDIKRVLAYSTISQLGYMFLAVGVGAFGAGIFHLTTHAFFKALLFLGSGSVILALHHQQDMRHMGGLKKHLPITYWTMLVATAAIAGVPLLSGFFSKDEILWKAFSSPRGSVILWLLGVLVAGLTALYMFRLLLLTFHGPERLGSVEHDEPPGAHHQAGSHPKEPSAVVTGPLMVLAFFSLVAGYVGLPAWTGAANWLEDFLKPSFRLQFELSPQAHGAAEEIALTGLTTLLALAGIFLAYQAYIRDPQLPDRLSRRFASVYGLLRGKFFVDELYEATLVRPLHRLSRGLLWQVIDVRWVDGAVNGTAALFQSCSNWVRLAQSGYVRSYAAWILAGASLLLLSYVLLIG